MRAPGRVAVTGSSGKLGRAVVAHLVEHGWQVLSLVRTRPPDVVTPFVSVDLTDYGQVAEVLGGGVDEHLGPLDAVVHLAAVPAPGLVTNAATFANNSHATYHVFAAARAVGARSVLMLTGVTGAERVATLTADQQPTLVAADAAELAKALETLAGR